jgi:RimJ/RimL family protein N-acetyltransferase
MQIGTDRLRLRSWTESDRDAFATLNDDAIVMADLDGPLDRELSDAKLDRYMEAFRRNGNGRWLIETHSGEFLGYCGVMPVAGHHPIGSHHERETHRH